MAGDSNSIQKGLKVVFLSTDTGGGHRASAESLGQQFQLHFSGSTYDLHDVLTEVCSAPFNTVKEQYKHLSSHPTQWKVLYTLTNADPVRNALESFNELMSLKKVTERIKALKPDVVISVHPMTNQMGCEACLQISQESGRHLPFFTVVTDLGTCHSSWFYKKVDQLFVPSEQIKKLAVKRGRVPKSSIRQIGLPIRHDFAVQAEALGDRNSNQGKLYQLSIREKLKLNTDNRTLLVMGGGEGVGSLSNIVDALYVELKQKSIDATIAVVCGRNEKLKQSLNERDWDGVLKKSNNEKNLGLKCVPLPPSPSRGCLNDGITDRIKRIVSSKTMLDAVAAPLPAGLDSDEDENEVEETGRTKSINRGGLIDVVGLGFVTNMAEYMVAADVLISKAGPGTIAEAAAVGLPVMCTSFLPGQEEGNADFVIDKGFGTFSPDYDPSAIAEEVAEWLLDDDLMFRMSKAASDAGQPTAASDIVREIGEASLRWKETYLKSKAFNEELIIKKSRNVAQTEIPKINS